LLDRPLSRAMTKRNGHNAGYLMKALV